MSSFQVEILHQNVTLTLCYFFIRTAAPFRRTRTEIIQMPKPPGRVWRTAFSQGAWMVGWIFWKEITSPIGSGGSQINAFAVFYFTIESCGNPQNIHKWKGVETTENSPCVSWFNGSLSKANSQRRESYHLLSRWTRELVLWRNIFSISSGGHGGSGWFCSFLRSSLVKNYIPVIKCLAIEFFFPIFKNLTSHRWYLGDEMDP